MEEDIIFYNNNTLLLRKDKMNTYLKKNGFFKYEKNEKEYKENSNSNTTVIIKVLELSEEGEEEKSKDSKESKKSREINLSDSLFIGFISNSKGFYYGFLNSQNFQPSEFGVYMKNTQYRTNYYIGEFSDTTSDRIRENISITCSKVSFTNFYLKVSNDSINKLLDLSIYDLKNEKLLEKENSFSIFLGNIENQINENKITNLIFDDKVLKNIEGGNINDNDLTDENKYSNFNSNPNYLSMFITETPEFFDLLNKKLKETFTSEEDSTMIQVKENIMQSLNLDFDSELAGITFKAFYGKIDNRTLEQDGILFMNSPTKKRVIYKGKMKNSFYQDSNGVYYEVDNNYLYKGEFSNNSFLKGVIAVNYDYRNLQQTNIIAYEFDSKNTKTEYKRIFNIDCLSNCFFMKLLMQKTKLDSAYILDDKDKDIHLEYKSSFTFIMDVIIKIMALSIFQKKLFSSNNELDELLLNTIDDKKTYYILYIQFLVENLLPHFLEGNKDNTISLIPVKDEEDKNKK